MNLTKEDIINIKKQKYDPKAIAYGQMANIGSQKSPEDKSILGKFPEGLSSSINSFFKGTTSFYDRVKKISDFSKAVITDEELDEGLTVTQILAGSLFLDYITTRVKELDSGSGAYQFESLLAAMAGGSVVGKGDVDTDADSGQMGGVDFVMNDGSYGSAKYYANLGSISQAISGFKNKKHKQVLYVIAHKTAQPDLTITRRMKKGVSDPAKIRSIIVYFVNVMPLKDEPTEASDFLIALPGAEPVKASSPKGDPTRINLFPYKPRSAAGIQIDLVKEDDGTLKDALSGAVGSKEKQIKIAVESFKKVFSELYSANQKAQRYASTGNEAQGDAALDVMVKADDALIDLVAAISPEKATDVEAAKIGTKRRGLAIAKESKLQSLDDLIAETVRDIKKNNK